MQKNMTIPTYLSNNSRNELHRGLNSYIKALEKKEEEETAKGIKFSKGKKKKGMLNEPEDKHYIPEGTLHDDILIDMGDNK